MLRPYSKLLISEIQMRCSAHKSKHSRRQDADITLFWHFCLFHGGHLENHQKWQVGPKISSVKILILHQGGPMNNIISLPEGP